MPTYQYACTDTACANRFELVQSFTDPNASECPKCAGSVRKVFSPVGVVFKGSGFYRNDSRKAARTESSDSESSTKSEPSKTAAASESGDSSSSSAKSADKSGSGSGDGSSSSGASSNGKSPSSSSGTSPAAASA
jgi:putative FmdB family regulatory protein